MVSRGSKVFVRKGTNRDVEKGDIALQRFLLRKAFSSTDVMQWYRTIRWKSPVFSDRLPRGSSSAAVNAVPQL